MTRKEYFRKCQPVFEKYLKEMQSDGVLAVRNSFDITCVKELMFRLDYDADDRNDDVPEFDKISPEFFLDEFLKMCDCWENMPELLLGGDAGYEIYREVVNTVISNWEEEHEEDEEQ